MWDMTPGIEANGEIERGGRKVEGMDITMAKRRQVAESVFARPRLGLRMADHRDVHAQHSTAEVPRQVARRTSGAASDVEYGRSRHDAGPPGQVSDLVRRQRTFLPNVCVAICQG